MSGILGKKVSSRCFEFLGANLPPEFATAVVGDGAVAQSGDGVTLSSAANGTASLSFGDVLSLPIDDLFAVEVAVELQAGTAGAAVPTTVEFGFGLISNFNANRDLIAEGALIVMQNGGGAYGESADGTNNIDDIASGVTLLAEGGVSTKLNLRIEMSGKEVKPFVHPSEYNAAKQGGKDNIHLSASDASQGYARRRLAPSQKFTMVEYAGSLQPVVYVKSAGDPISCKVVQMDIDRRINY